MMKKYYGEKYAFFYAFHLNYTGFLIYPLIFGIACFSYQVYEYATSPKYETNPATGKPDKKKPF